MAAVTCLAVGYGGSDLAYAAPEPVAPVSSTAVMAPSQASGITDRELNRMIELLDQLPKGLKNADPKTTPGYEARLSQALNSVGLQDHTSISTGRVIVLATWWGCAIAVAGVIVQYGLPVGMILKWLKDYKRLYGGVKAIWQAIKDGRAIAKIGEESVQVIEMLLGAGDVINACFG